MIGVCFKKSKKRSIRSNAIL